MTSSNDGQGCQTTGVKEQGMFTQGKLRNLGDPSCSMLITPERETGLQQSQAVMAASLSGLYRANQDSDNKVSEGEGKP